jgi:hypothetical protein
VRKIVVERSEQTLEQLKPHFWMVRDDYRIKQREIAANLQRPDLDFKEGTSKALLDFLIASVAAGNRVAPDDRNEVKKKLKQARAVRCNIQTSCQLWKYDDSLHDNLRKGLKISSRYVTFLEDAVAAVGKLPRGAKRFGPFKKFVRALAKRYDSATDHPAIVKFNNSRGPNRRCSGTFADLLEKTYAQASEIWKVSGLNFRLAAPTTREARLDYARKEVQSMRRDR